MTAERPRSSTVSRQAMVRFLVCSVVLIALAAVVTVVLVRHVARENALVVAEDDVGHLADFLVLPAISRGLLEEDPQAQEWLRGMIQGRLADESLARVKVWDADGRIVWSDQAELIGRTFELEPEDAALLEDGGAHAEVTALDSEENVLEAPAATQLVEVYVGRRMSDQPVLVEAYVPMTHIETDQALLTRQVLPLTVGVVVLLGLSLLPLALSLARRVEVAQDDRRRMLVHAAAASDHERRRLVGELHDGVVQDLTGVAYSLASLRGRLDGTVPEATSAEIARDAAVVRGDVRALRTLMVDLYPADLERAGLRTAIEQVADPLRARGLDLDLRVDPRVDDLPTAPRALLYRAAREGLANVAKHAVGARTVQVVLTRDGDLVTLRVRDDGPGPGSAGDGPGAVPRPTEDGHMGLGLLADALGDAGGSLQLAGSPEGGTTLTVTVPASAG